MSSYTLEEHGTDGAVLCEEWFVCDRITCECLECLRVLLARACFGGLSETVVRRVREESRIDVVWWTALGACWIRAIQNARVG